MRFGVGVAVSVLVLGVAVACNGGGSGTSPGVSDASEDAAPPCIDMATPNPIFDLLSNPNVACPLNSAMDMPVSFDMAITTSCPPGMKSGDIQYGQCLDYLVWELDVDSSGTNFSKCYYDVKTHALVGVLYGDGTMDQCNMTSYTIQAGSLEPQCTVDVGTGMYESCVPIREGGLEGG
jgi:hypothetical protein